MSYKNLEIWKIARTLSIEIHKISLKLPKYELYETGSQARRSAKSVRSNIVEGFGRRKYKSEFIRFIIIALASCDETIDHIETLIECHSLTDDSDMLDLLQRYQLLAKKISKFIQALESGHNANSPTN